MPTNRADFFRLAFLAALAVAIAAIATRAQTSAGTADPRITSWQTSRSGVYVRVWETNAADVAAVATKSGAFALGSGVGAGTGTALVEIGVAP